MKEYSNLIITPESIDFGKFDTTNFCDTIIAEVNGINFYYTISLNAPIPVEEYADKYPNMFGDVCTTMHYCADEVTDNTPETRKEVITDIVTGLIDNPSYAIDESDRDQVTNLVSKLYSMGSIQRQFAIEGIGYELIDRHSEYLSNLK